MANVKMVTGKANRLGATLNIGGKDVKVGDDGTVMVDPSEQEVFESVGFLTEDDFKKAALEAAKAPVSKEEVTTEAGGMSKEDAAALAASMGGDDNSTDEKKEEKEKEVADKEEAVTEEPVSETEAVEEDEVTVEKLVAKGMPAMQKMAEALELPKGEWGSIRKKVDLATYLIEKTK